MKCRLLAIWLTLCLLCGLFCLPEALAADYESEVDIDVIVEGGIAMFSAHEGNYDTVVVSDVGAVGMGILGWRGPRALLLLQMICQKAPELSLELLGEALYQEVVTTTDYTLWNNRVFTEEEAASAKQLLGTEYGIAAENEQARNDITLYVSYAWKAGIRSDAAILYYCSIENHYGHGGATKFMRYIRETLGITESDTINSLDEFHAAVIRASETYSYIGDYLFYRTKIYNYIKNVLGWDTAPGPGGPEICVDCPSAGFTDVPPKGNWAHDGIDFAIENGLFRGTSATTFSPNLAMTRGMLVTVLHRLAGSPAVTSGCAFTDVFPGSYYETAICWAAEKGIVNGVSAERFAPDRSVTREQLATILYRYATVFGGAQVNDPLLLMAYGDGPLASSFARTALSWAIEQDLIRGKTSNGELLLDPQGPATRAQVAVILMRYLT